MPERYNPERYNKVLAFSGGVGGAKLALGLSHLLTPEQLTIVVNTADDFEHLGLSISPDIDTLIYTLAGLNDQQQGWGLANESWQVMAALEQRGSETWFRLGDRDIATHLERSQRLASGQTLAEVTAALADQLGVKHPILPMSDDPVRTRLLTAEGELAFQQYFVREQCQPVIDRFYFSGLDQARPQADFLRLLQSEPLDAIIICPSNPFLSVEPIISLQGVRQAMRDNPAPVVAISPIVAGLAIKGPAAKMMQELSMPATALAVAEYYGDLLDGFVIDESDRALLEPIKALGIDVAVCPTVMKNLQDRIDLAASVLSFSQTISRNS